MNNLDDFNDNKKYLYICESIFIILISIFSYNLGYFVCQSDSHDYQYKLVERNTQLNDLNKLLISHLPSFKCSWYAKGFEGKRTASGAIYRSNGLTCAGSKRFKLGQRILLINPANGNKVIVTVNDRGGFEKYGRDLDLSRGSFEKLGDLSHGILQLKGVIL